MTRYVPRTLKRLLKTALAHGLYRLGLLQAWQRHVFRQGAVVLMYHRVLSAEEQRTTGSHPAMVVSRETFARQVTWLRQHFSPVSLETFVSHLRDRRPFADSTCLITFDDGWRDNLTNAIPVLAAQAVPAAIFLPVGFIETRRQFLREAFVHLMVRARDRAAADAVLGARLRRVLAPAGFAALLDVRDPDPRRAILDQAGDTTVDATIETLVTQLQEVLDIRVDSLETPDTFMTWDEVRALDRHGVSFGGHGAEHRPLTRLTPEACAADVRRSQVELTAQLGHAATAFAYPNGACNEMVTAAVAGGGFDVAFTTRSGPVRCDDPPLLIKRVNIHEDLTDSAPVFLARLVGLF